MRTNRQWVHTTEDIVHAYRVCSNSPWAHALTDNFVCAEYRAYACPFLSQSEHKGWVALTRYNDEAMKRCRALTFILPVFPYGNTYLVNVPRLHCSLFVINILIVNLQYHTTT